jgi:hypothetical protein
MMSLDPRLGVFFEASGETPSIDHFPPWLYFSKLATEFFSLPSSKYLCFVPTSCLDGSHEGDVIAHETTHNEYLRM